jgi:hypothetical protein
VDLSDRGQWAEATERFSQALELRPAASIRYNFAASLARLDRHVEAAEQLDLLLADPEADAALRARAEQLLAEVVPRTASLRIALGDVTAEATLLLDGAELPRDRVSSPVRVAPGAHVVTATVDGAEVARAEADVPAGETSEVELAPLPTPEETAVAAVAQTTPESEPEPEPAGPRPLYADWRLWTGVGAGVAVIAAVTLGLVFGLEEQVEDPVRGNMDPAVLTWR